MTPRLFKLATLIYLRRAAIKHPTLRPYVHQARHIVHSNPPDLKAALLSIKPTSFTTSHLWIHTIFKLFH